MQLVRSSVAGITWERTLDEILLKDDWEKVNSWECFYFRRKALLFLLVYVDDCKMVGRKRTLGSDEAQTRENTDLEDPTPLLNQVYLHCTQRLAYNDERSSQL